MGWSPGLRKSIQVVALINLLAATTSMAQFYPQPFDTKRGTVGLTLSGGGGRGFAHIGVLHVIDSLGLKIDYISGTSMGAIVGGLYAVGYSAAEIEKLALSVDWESVLGARPFLEYVHPRNRRQAGRSVVSVPIEKGRLRLTTGAIEGPQLWTTLEGLFFHVRTVNDFSDLKIPFACVATDIETGEAVVINSGDIISAIRASMSIPAVFSTVQRDGRKLIDGGATNNFPVDVVKSMGAEYVIGVYASEGLKPAERLQTPWDIIYQMGLFKDAHMVRINRDITDMYIVPDLKEFNVASFTQVKEIIERGKKEALKFIHDLEVITLSNPVDSLSASDIIPKRLNTIVVDTLIVQGLNRIRQSYVMNKLPLRQGDTLDVNDINRMISQLYATDYFDRVNYNIQPSPFHPGRRDLLFSVVEKPFSRLEAAIHYSSFTGVGVISGINFNKFLLYNLNAYAKVLISEQPAFRAGFDLYTAERQNAWISLQTSGDILNFPVYDDFDAVAGYQQGYWRAETSFNRLAGPNTIFSLGAATYYQRLTSTLRVDKRISGNTSGYQAFAFYNIYTLNRHDLPQRGQNLELKTTYFFNQNPLLRIESGTGQYGSLQDIGIRFRDFVQVKFNWESYLPVHSRMTLFTHLQGGLNVNYSQGFINMFNLGGTYPFLRDQFVFAGLKEYEVITASVLTAAIGWHVNLWSDFYLKPVFNVAVYDFDNQSDRSTLIDRMLMGAGLSFDYLSPLGPLSTTISYSPQTNRINAYVNLGWSF